MLMLQMDRIHFELEREEALLTESPTLSTSLGASCPVCPIGLQLLAALSSQDRTTGRQVLGQFGGILSMLELGGGSSGDNSGFSANQKNSSSKPALGSPSSSSNNGTSASSSDSSSIANSDFSSSSSAVGMLIAPNGVPLSTMTPLQQQQQQLVYQQQVQQNVYGGSCGLPFDTILQLPRHVLVNLGAPSAAISGSLLDSMQLYDALAEVVFADDIGMDL
jgi:hypothetical protein